MNIEAIHPKYAQYLGDESRLTGAAEGIVFPQSAQELAQALRSAAQSGLRATAQGARTGLSGGAVPRGGLIVNLTRMNRILGIGRNGDGAFLRAEGGATLEQIEREAAARGLFFPPDPSEKTATVGGMFTTGASGMCGLRYGRMSAYVRELIWITPAGELWRVGRGEHVFAAEGCVMPDGRLLETGLAEAKPGMDLVDFLSGSEGRLGIAAELVLSLMPAHGEVWGVVFFFDKQNDMLEFSKGLYAFHAANRGLLHAVEYFNDVALRLIQSHGFAKPQPLPEFTQSATAALYVELRGDEPSSLEEALEALLVLFEHAGGRDDHAWAEMERGIQRLRDMRHTLVEALYAEPQAADGGVPLRACFSGRPERFAESLESYLSGLEREGLYGAVYGHLFENRLHIAISPRSAAERDKAIRLLRGLAEDALKAGGSCASEYGEGKLETPWLDPVNCAKRDARLVALRSFFDPQGRMGD